MVAYNILADDDEFKTTYTVSDWVQSFRVKKMQMKRKFRGSNLRIAAIITTALNSAEFEMRRKQQERFQRWVELQADFKRKLEHSSCNSSSRSCYDDEAEVQNQRHAEIDNLWKSELKDLDDFMKSLSSSNRNCESISNDNVNNNSVRQTRSIEVAN